MLKGYVNMQSQTDEHRQLITVGGKHIFECPFGKTTYSDPVIFKKGHYYSPQVIIEIVSGADEPAGELQITARLEND